MRDRFVYAQLVLAGGVSALGFAPFDLLPLTLCTLILCFDLLVRAPDGRSAFFRGWAFGVGHFLVGLNWIAKAFTYQANMPAWYGWAAVVLLGLYLALFPALAAALTRISRQHPPSFIFIFAAAWMLGEWLRGTLLTGFAWNPLGVIWLSLPAVAQCARWIGTYGLSGLTILVAGLLWLGLRRRWRSTLGVALSATCVLLWHDHRVMVAHESPTAPAIAFRIVQPNISQDEKYDPAQTSRHARIYAHLSGAPGSVPRLILWPEAATLRFLELDSRARAELAGLLGPRDLLITGGESVIPAEDARSHGVDVYHNSVFALDSRGDLQWRYDKAHLVPFGEYLPLRPILTRWGLSRLAPGEGDFSAGQGPETFPLPGFSSGGQPATLGVQICYEITFSGHVINRAERPTLLFNPSTDAWFGAWGPPQHLAQARLRAVEEGIPVLRATPNGISALIGPRGQLIATVPPHQAGVIDGIVPPRLPPTLFSRFGLLASGLFGVVLTFVGAVLRVMVRRDSGSLLGA